MGFATGQANEVACPHRLRSTRSYQLYLPLQALDCHLSPELMGGTFLPAHSTVRETSRRLDLYDAVVGAVFSASLIGRTSINSPDAA
jgi:hypothetical protein